MIYESLSTNQKIGLYKFKYILYDDHDHTDCLEVIYYQLLCINYCRFD